MPPDTQPTGDAAGTPSPRCEGSALGSKASDPITVVQSTNPPQSTHPVPEEESPPPSKSTRSLKGLLGLEPDRSRGGQPDRPLAGFIHKIRRKVVKYTKFIGPGFMVSVAYIDPGTSPRTLPLQG
jgi:hypothetical protein